MPQQQETIALTGAIGNLNEIGAVTLNADDGITMSSNITLADSAGADLDVNGKVFISGDVTIDTHNTTDDGTINFSSTIDGVSGGTDDDLVILAGDTDAGAALTITGNIGDGVPLTTLKINEECRYCSFIYSSNWRRRHCRCYWTGGYR